MYYNKWHTHRVCWSQILTVQSTEHERKIWWWCEFQATFLTGEEWAGYTKREWVGQVVEHWNTMPVSTPTTTTVASSGLKAIEVATPVEHHWDRHRVKLKASQCIEGTAEKRHTLSTPEESRQNYPLVREVAKMNHKTFSFTSREIKPKRLNDMFLMELARKNVILYNRVNHFSHMLNYVRVYSFISSLF